MNKIKKLILLMYIMLLAGPLSAIDIDFESITYDVELRTAAFFPIARRYKEIYGDVGPSVQIEVGARFDCPYEAWINLDWVYGEKHSRYTRTTSNLFNVSFGLKYIYLLSEKCSLSVGFGPTFGGIFLRNHSISYSRNPSRFVAGGVLKSSAKYKFCSGLFVDAFLDYMCEPVCYGTMVDIGGFRLGLGLGYSF